MKQPLLPFIIVAVMMMLLLGVAIVRGLMPPEPPLAYMQAEYEPERRVLAPGQTLIYTPTLTVNHAGRVELIRSFWDVGRNQSAMLCDDTLAPSVEIVRALPPLLHGVLRQQPVRLPIPNLKPGTYLLVTSATNPEGGEAVTQVPFRVTQRCNG